MLIVKLLCFAHCCNLFSRLLFLFSATIMVNKDVYLRRLNRCFRRLNLLAIFLRLIMWKFDSAIEFDSLGPVKRAVESKVYRRTSGEAQFHPEQSRVETEDWSSTVNDRSTFVANGKQLRRRITLMGTALFLNPEDKQQDLKNECVPRTAGYKFPHLISKLQPHYFRNYAKSHRLTTC